MDFSLLMSIYYKEKGVYLEECFKSLLLSTIKPTEIILVKDGELTVELDNIIDNYKSQLPLKIVFLEQNVGLGEALKIGLEACSYNLVARFDTDDINDPQRFSKQLEYFKKDEEIVLVGSQIQEFDSSGILKSRKVPISNEEIKLYAPKRNPFNHMTVMFKKDVIERVGNYKRLEGFEDYYLWLRVLNENYKTANIDEVLVNARAGSEMLERRGGIKYAKYVYQAFTTFSKEGLITKKEAKSRMYSQIIFSLLPKFIRKIIYQKILRG